MIFCATAWQPMQHIGSAVLSITTCALNPAGTLSRQ